MDENDRKKDEKGIGERKKKGKMMEDGGNEKKKRESTPLLYLEIHTIPSKPHKFNPSPPNSSGSLQVHPMASKSNRLPQNHMRQI